MIAVVSEDGDGRIVRLTTADSLARLLSDRAAALPDGVELRVRGADDQFPSLLIGARGEVAFLHHFPRDGHPGFHSLGEPAAEPQRREFPAARARRVPGSHVVPLDRAVDAALEFLSEPAAPPASLAWVERD